MEMNKTIGRDFFKNKLRIQLVQVNFTYGNNAFLPYSAGLLQAYVQSCPEIIKFCDFLPIEFLRTPPDETKLKANAIDLVGLSAYIWNWEYVKNFASVLKKVSPETLIVVGGPQVEAGNENFLIENSNFDIAVHGEGEKAFLGLIESLIGHKELSQVDGISYFDPLTLKVVKTNKSEREKNLDIYPSPYLDGIFDGIIAEHNFGFQASQETHRGCPYSCTFCDWGSATMQKINRFSSDRILSEYEWMAKNRIEILYNCDANYGIFKEDKELTERLTETKKRFGFPQKFRAAFAKNSNERVFEIAKMLNDAEMSKGVTLSLQSLDEITLENIKRKNMRINDFSELINVYDTNKMATYTELIAGLPGESLESFKGGIYTLLNAGQHNGLNIYPAMILPNAKMNDPIYKRVNGIKHVRTPMLLNHGTRLKDDIQEFYDIVVETKTMSQKDWIKTMVFSWAIQGLHCMNLTQMVSRSLLELFGISYEDFYSKLIYGGASRNSLLGKNLDNLKSLAEGVCEQSGSFDLEDARFGNIIWPVEEVLFLRLYNDGFLQELKNILVNEFQLPLDLIDDLVEFQKFSLRSVNDYENQHIKLKYDWPSALKGNVEQVSKEVNLVKVNPQKFFDIKDYAREVVWYGRKGSTLISDFEISEN
jgi:radical SAM superfamily enzyme YgiQ (UPF0313 family)